MLEETGWIVFENEPWVTTYQTKPKSGESEQKKVAYPEPTV